MNIVRVPSWGFGLYEAAYYGWKHCLHVGPVLIFFGAFDTKEGQE